MLPCATSPAAARPMKTPDLSPAVIRPLVRAALREDLGARGDVTALATIPADARSHARLIAKEPGVVSGLQVAMETFRQLDPRVKFTVRRREGSKIRRGEVVLEIRGRTRAILSAERTALNFVQRLSGVATLTRRFVERTRGSRARILDTRKTTPLLRILEKHAVLCGGGTNHRMGLHDMVLIKDNHLAALAGQFPDPFAEAVSRARRRWPGLKVEVECDTLVQVHAAVRAGADIILLDNMEPRRLRRAVKAIGRRSRTEASGGITLRTVGAVAATGVDLISVGALTHSAGALDLSLEVDA